MTITDPQEIPKPIESGIVMAVSTITAISFRNQKVMQKELYKIVSTHI